MNLKNADLTSPVQKLIAAGFGVGILALLYVLLPPLVFILKNIWLTIGLSVPLLFLVYNYEIAWDLLKRLSWDLTKKAISTNKLWHMWQGYHYLVAKNNALNENIVSVGAIQAKTQRELVRIAKEANDAKEQALHHEKKGTTQTVLKVLYNKAALLDTQFKTLEPKLKFIESQRSQLIELHNNWVADAEMLKQTLEVKEQEYNLMKELSTASNTAMSFLKRDSPEMKNFDESLKQIEESISQFTSNVENFQRNVLPTIQTMDTQREMNEEEGRKLIEEFKQQRLALKA